MSDGSHDSNESVVVLPEGRHTPQGAASPDQAVAAREIHPPAPLLTKLLQIGDRYRADNSLRQAMSIYFELAEDHPGTPEACDALERLLEIATRYEREGEIHQARSLYERLL